MTTEEKAMFLRSGMEANSTSDLVDRLCMAIAMLTSQEKSKRETAKRRVREYVEAGKSKTHP